MGINWEDKYFIDVSVALILVSIQALVLDLLMVIFSTLDLSEMIGFLSGVRQRPLRPGFNNADLIAVTGTWLRPKDTESFISSITPPGYKFTHVP